MIDFNQLAHALKRQGQHRFAASLRVDMPSHRGAAAVGNHDQVLLAGPSQQLADLRGALRIGHAIGEHAKITRTHRQPIRQALAAGMAHAVFGI